MVAVYLNWFSWIHFLILQGGLLVTLIVCIIFLLPLLDVTKVSMSTVSFLAQLDSGIFCQLNASLWTYDRNGCKSRINR